LLEEDVKLKKKCLSKKQRAAIKARRLARKAEFKKKEL